MKASEPHQFVVSEEDLFFCAEPTTQELRLISCCVCGDQPGQGMHRPPSPPLHTIVIDEVAKRLAESIAVSWDTLRPEASRAAFTTVQKVRAFLVEMSKRGIYSDPHDMGDPFADIDTELDRLLTELRKAGWDQ